MDQGIHRINTLDLRNNYEEGKERLEGYQILRSELMHRLERAKIYELLGLKNELEELEIALTYIEEQINKIEDFKSKYEAIFSMQSGRKKEK